MAKLRESNPLREEEEWLLDEVWAAIDAEEKLPPGIELAFCPTGPGGGVDNSCSSKDGGGGPDYSGPHAEKLHELDESISKAVKAREEAKANIKAAKASGDKKELSYWRKVRLKANKEIEALQQEKIKLGGKAEYKTYQKKFSAGQIQKLTGKAKTDAISHNAAATATVKGDAAKTVFDDKGNVKESCCIDPGMQPTAEMNERVYKQFLGFDQKLETSERNAILNYSGSGYASINNKLRSSKGKEVSETIKNMDKAFKKAPALTEDLVVRRGVGSSGGVFDKLQTGDVFQDHGFVSTSAKPGGGFSKSTSIHIRVPKGAKGIYMDSKLSLHSSEREFLLPRGSKFRVTGVKTVGGKRQVQMEYLL